MHYRYCRVAASSDCNDPSRDSLTAHRAAEAVASDGQGRVLDGIIAMLQLACVRTGKIGLFLLSRIAFARLLRSRHGRFAGCGGFCGSFMTPRLWLWLRHIHVGRRRV